MTKEQEAAIIEAMARAMCEASLGGRGHQTPDDPAIIESHDHLRGYRSGKMWELFRTPALLQLRAHMAMEKELRDWNWR